MKNKRAYQNDAVKEYDLEGDGIPCDEEGKVQESECCDDDNCCEDRPKVTVYHKESKLPKILFYGFVSLCTIGVFTLACAAIANWLEPEDYD